MKLQKTYSSAALPRLKTEPRNNYQFKTWKFLQITFDDLSINWNLRSTTWNHICQTTHWINRAMIHPAIADNHLCFSGMRRHGPDGYHATRWSPSCSMLLIGTIMLNSTRWVRVDFQNSCHGACPSNTHHLKLMPCHMPTNHSYDRCQKKIVNLASESGWKSSMSSFQILTCECLCPWSYVNIKLWVGVYACRYDLPTFSCWVFCAWSLAKGFKKKQFSRLIVQACQTFTQSS